MTSSELIATISRLMDDHGVENGAFVTPVPGLRLLRSFGEAPPRHMNYRPALCLVAQGAKQVIVGDRTITYGDMQSLIVTVEVPVLGHIFEASLEKPFLGATLELSADIILDVLTRLGSAAPSRGSDGFSFVVSEMDDEITGSIIRLLRAIERPQAVEILYPAIMREITYWLLTGPAGRNVARMVLPDGQPQRIARAIHHLRDTFDAPLSVAELARTAGMSASSFHHHFRTLTSMSPLQYQKHLRLLEARRLMVAEGERAGAAAFTVGYESVSQFSREYARMFGAPPRREAQRARAALPTAAGDQPASELAEAV